jgi:hypothetical protein
MHRVSFEEIDPTGFPENLPFIIDDVTLATTLNTSLKGLWSVLHNVNGQYRVFPLDNGKGKIRIIHAPSPFMKWLSTNLRYTLLEPLQEELGEHVTAYRPGRRIVDAVKRHIPACPICDRPDPWLHQTHSCPRDGSSIHLDLKNFFNSTRRAWVRGYFKSLGYGHTAASYMASLCTCVLKENPDRWGVPQGSPLSGAICNLVADSRLDPGILKYLETLNKSPRYQGSFQWVYSRYSDDLAFTCGHSLTKSEIKDFLRDICRLIRKAGYDVNIQKTRWTHRGWRKHLLGVNMNQSVNPDPYLYKKVRGILHRCSKTSLEEQSALAKELHDIDDLPSWLMGQINWIAQLNPVKGDRLKTLYQSLKTKEGDA